MKRMQLVPPELEILWLKIIAKDNKYNADEDESFFSRKLWSFYNKLEVRALAQLLFSFLFKPLDGFFGLPLNLVDTILESSNAAL